MHPGKYSPTTGNHGCLICSQGRYGGSLGLSSCLTCPVGTSSNVEGAEECSPCPTGRFAAAEGTRIFLKVESTDVPILDHWVLPGSRTCTQCPIGRFSDAEGGCTRYLQSHCFNALFGRCLRLLCVSSWEICFPLRFKCLYIMPSLNFPRHSGTEVSISTNFLCSQ